ncbi:MAG: FtsX-like permease family protein [Gammaproteobacteria bacterium]|jgi:putative ABC transport system permease protein|nr:FtsX-like permease family protein [Gammaproteobacteria bacterium]MBT3858556.1 FtsX-like permease family protein [Gammaproteobacteria bacterium]MBT3986706.1 FtsX-like permease family protein [Gammaproteobacteria bacterium]MBT4582802.1 FtsX-like permease family protein [Gammaproteobacteria bacterium]MBT4657525.1 FtsX-like permease family protein [Gammaproteobacteria bacterium]
MIGHFTKMAVKALLKFKLHSIINLFSLSFGFICFIVAFLLSDYLDSFDQQFPNADRIYNVVIRNVGNETAGPDNFPIVNEPASKYLRSYFPEIPNIVRASNGDLESISIDGVAHSVTSRYVEDRFFDIFPVETLHGLAAGEPMPPNSTMLMEESALQLFGRTDVIGERIIVDNRTDVAVVGVIKTLDQPSHLQFATPLFSPDMFLPMSIRDQEARERRIAAGSDPDADNWGNQSDYVYIEIPESMDFDQAEFHQRLTDFVQSNLPEERRDQITYELIPVNELVMTTLSFVTGGFSLVNILIFAGGLVLLIGCLNYSNLVVAQLSLRSQEIAVQKILGSKRSLLVLQYSYESLLFVGITLALVMLVAYTLLSIMGSANLVGVGPAMLLSSSLWLAIGSVVVIIVLIAGCYPALRTATVPLVAMMRPKGSGGYSGRMRSVMVGVQFFVSGTLMIMAFVMYLQNSAMTQQLDGIVSDPKIVIATPIDTFTVSPELLINELTAHPGVISVSQSHITPWSISSSGIEISESEDVNEPDIIAGVYYVSYDYLETMDVPLTAGRDFSRERSTDRYPLPGELEVGNGPYPIILDNQSAQALGWDSATEAVGERLYLRDVLPEGEVEISVELNVIGAIDALKYQFVDFGSFGIQGNVLILQPDIARLMIVKISKENVNDALQHIENTWARLMPTIPLQREFVDDLFMLTYELFQAISVAITVLSLLGFLIASIGLLGNATFITNIRQKEVGIRKVMGASSGRLLRMLLLDFAKPIIIANALAIPVGYLVGNAYISLFAARAELTVFPFIISLILSVLIAVAAVLSQSWKSAKVRPAMVLRYE